MGEQEACRYDPRQCCDGETPGVQSAQPGGVADHVEGQKRHQAAGENHRRQRVLRAEEARINLVSENPPKGIMPQNPCKTKGDQSPKFRRTKFLFFIQIFSESKCKI